MLVTLRGKRVNVNWTEFFQENLFDVGSWHKEVTTALPLRCS